MSNDLEGFSALLDRVLVFLVKIHEKPFNLAVIQVYAPTSESGEEDLDAFYSNLDGALKTFKSQKVIFMMGDLNAKISTEKKHDGIGSHGIGERKERGEKLIEWCVTNDQVITNTWFDNHPRRKYTLKSLGDKARNMIDYITINRQFQNVVLQYKIYPGADCGSDHNQVVCKIRINLSQNDEIKVKYYVEVGNGFQLLTEEKRNGTHREKRTTRKKTEHRELEVRFDAKS
ncbi:hypothetical protein HELRODRAFT_182122 [Helobdella robusta]|uniref:Endonuclease/exonuclease/phosphatase domain-containing protein n=1 Tax=Helobdella robusta TaxID=6412 RepID=T1FHS6_HELRO|nr:hypothetical protein HELRODRAFT_182122 [Helobdella robusta]ESN91263.1 hypothetical protein HELRODRAFT_182122 [Helobdella robusta]